MCATDTKNFTISEYVTFAVSISIFITPLTTLINFTEQWQNGVTGFKRFTEIIDEKELLTSLFISMRHYIITDIKDLQIIFKGIKKQTNKKIKKMKLIYSALEDGDSAESFHKHCDGISNTLIIIKTINGKKFGGFTTQKWKNNNNYVMDNAAFLFSFF